ncbi:hypothetical protein LX59_03018 [Azomonas agilis]|uniref:Uncharacterized protein n=1 Tax=Azomonas agilis TaxID=116849 RepID=A0A562HZ82_9GAMM|nr:hypothetical protein [Azomonas agilis]TWH63854.1 hypothetical protein LX59_03018 [Azomonas agilis]
MTTSLSDEVHQKIAFLNILQGIINRLANTVSVIKGASVTVFSALLAFSSGEKINFSGWVFIAPSIVFWFMHAYFLQQERAFRKIYNREAMHPEKAPVSFIIEKKDLDNVRENIWSVFFSKTVAFFNLGMFLSFILVYNVGKAQGNVNVERLAGYITSLSNYFKSFCQ